MTVLDMYLLLMLTATGSRTVYSAGSKEHHEDLQWEIWEGGLRPT